MYQHAGGDHNPDAHNLRSARGYAKYGSQNSGMLGHPDRLRDSGQAAGDKPTPDSNSDEGSSSDESEDGDDDDGEDEGGDEDEDGDDGDDDGDDDDGDGDDERNLPTENAGAPLQHSYAHPSLVYTPVLPTVTDDARTWNENQHAPPVQQTIAGSNTASASHPNRYPGPSVPAIPRPVVLNSPTTANAASSSYVGDPPTATNAVTNGNTHNSKPSGNAEKPSRKKKHYSRPKMFYPSALFGQKRSIGVMEACEAAKLAGPTKKQKKAMSIAGHKATWSCQLCGARFNWENQLKSHLRSPQHADSAVRVDKETYDIWFTTWMNGMGKKDVKKYWRWKNGKGKGNGKENGAEKVKGKKKKKKGKGKGKGAPLSIPTTVDVTGPPTDTDGNLAEGLSSLGLGGSS